MEYQEFLKTPYWKAIAAHSKYKAGYRCQVCNSIYDLATHHRNYAIYGFEHAHMHELIVLCDDCHSKFHGQISKSKLKAKAALIVLITKSMVLSANAHQTSMAEYVKVSKTYFNFVIKVNE